VKAKADTPGSTGDAEGLLRTPSSSSVLTALKQAPLGVAIFDREMRYLTASSRFLTDQGRPGDMPLVGHLHYDVFPEVPQRWRDIHARALRDGVELSHEADAFINPAGALEWIRWSVTPWRTDEGEIGGLVLYTEVVTSSVEARLSLEATEARYRAVFDQVAMGVARVAPDGRILEVNDRFCAIAGYAREDLVKLSFQDITHPDDLAEDMAKVEAALAGEFDTYSMEKRYITARGETVWINLTVSLVRDETGAPDYFVSIIDDIGYRKEAEAQQQHYQSQLRLMINELNHRVKNTLATVQSMAAQTMRGETDLDGAYRKFTLRLMGLAEVHDVLTRERWHGAALQEVAERALKPFASQATGQVMIRGPQVWLQPGAALTMALVFHELATNAVKYGALSVEKGRVNLKWTLDGPTERLRMEWAETRGPAVAKPTHKGFGSRLIERGLKGELRGHAELSYAPSGLVCTMDARLPKATETPGPFGDL
jgi:PAS domain S-box-containing protein